MTLATRTRHGINMHASFVRDVAEITAFYDVQGTDKMLTLVSWIEPAEGAEDAAVVDAMLEFMDQVAQENAAHPETFQPHSGYASD